MEVKKEIFIALGSDLTLKDKKLSVSLDNLLFPIQTAAKEAQEISAGLEPAKKHANKKENRAFVCPKSRNAGHWTKLEPFYWKENRFFHTISLTKNDESHPLYQYGLWQKTVRADNRRHEITLSVQPENENSIFHQIFYSLMYFVHQSSQNCRFLVVPLLTLSRAEDLLIVLSHLFKVTETRN